MNYKNLVEQLYPDAILLQFETFYSVLLGATYMPLGLTEEHAWEIAWNRIQMSMIKSLE